MKAYIAVSFSQRNNLKHEINAIKSSLNKINIESIVFVDEFQFAHHQQKEMMTKAFDTIEQCDLLIAESSHKAIGVGIEAGFAKGKGKTVIYMRNENAEHSTTLAGLSDFEIIYKNVIDLEKQLENTLQHL